MIIQHNIVALNSYNRLANNNSSVSKNLEKLSSGYRINRAGDDAAGLAISEKMRAQVTGLDRAKLNAQDGISLVQTAEGALTEVHSILNRLVELGTESANGIYQSDDRAKIQDEVTQSLAEIDRISKATNFNGINLLDGSLGEKSAASDIINKAQQLVMPQGTLNSTGVSGTINGSAAVGTAVGATSQKTVIDTASIDGTAKIDNNNYDAMKFTFKDSDGTEKTFTVYETAKGSIAPASAGADIAATINGGGLGTFKVDDADAMKRFTELFDVSTDAATGALVEITAKTGGTKAASLTSVEFGADATNLVKDVATAATTKTTAVGAAGSIAAQDAGVKVSMVSAQGGDTLKVGDKTYEFVAAAGDAVAAGNVAVVSGATDADTMKNLIEALKKDGVDAEIVDPGVGGTASELLITTKVGTDSASSKWSEATKQKNVYTNTDLGFTAANFDAVKFEFRTADGQTHSFDLFESALDTVDVAGNANSAAVTAIEATINGMDKADTGLTFNTGDALTMQEFAKHFDVKVNGNNLEITAKEAGVGGAEMLGITRASDDAGKITDVDDAVVANNLTKTTIAKDPSSIKAQKEGISVGMTGILTGDKMEIGGQTYEFVAAAGDSASRGNIAVVKGATDADTIKNMADALKQNGIEAEKKEGEDALLITSTDKLMETQKGMDITASNSAVRVEKNAASSNTTKVTMGPADKAGTFKLNVNYVDSDGKSKSAELEYKLDPKATGSQVADAIKDSFSKNSELRDLFDVDVQNGDISFVSKAKGENGAKVVGVTTNDTTPGAVSSVQVSNGVTEGKTISFANGENMKNGDTMDIGGKTFEFVTAGEKAKDGNIAVTIGTVDGAETMENLQKALKDQGIETTLDDSDVSNPKLTIANDQIYESEKVTGGGLTLQVGDTAADYNKVTVYVDDMSSKGLALDGLKVEDQELSSQSIDKIKTAIEKVSVNRGRLGALQNRMEHTINNLAVTSENMTAAESRVRDTDMAKEMMAFTKNNVLVQAAQSMLAQANQQPQQVLQLLR